MTYEVDEVRRQFPALAGGTAFFDGPGGTQTPGRVADAIARTMTSPLSNRGADTTSARNADDVVRTGREAMAALLGADPAGIAFGRSATQFTTDISRALSRDWGPGDEIVVSRIDHDSNIRPWIAAATDKGAAVRWIEFDTVTGDVSVDAVRDVVGERTKVVALTGASNFFGTMPDLPAIADVVHAAGALFYVDGVHLTPHQLIDLGRIGADAFVCSPYKFCGPHMGVLAGKPEVLETIAPYKLAPSSDDVPERFELGTLPYEAIAGARAAVEFLAALSGDAGTLRERLTSSYAALINHEDGVFAQLIEGLGRLDNVAVIGDPARRTPTALFAVDGFTPAEVAARLGAHDICVGGGHFYAQEAAAAAGLTGGAVRAGIAPYTTSGDVQRLLDGVAGLG